LYVDGLIAEYRGVEGGNREKIAQKLAEILDHVSYLHPFREGNCRTQREFVRIFALEKGYKLNLNPPDNAYVYER
jgi:cell filamentation protein